MKLKIKWQNQRPSQKRKNLSLDGLKAVKKLRRKRLFQRETQRLVNRYYKEFEEALPWDKFMYRHGYLQAMEDQLEDDFEVGNIKKENLKRRISIISKLV